ncbi:hypothetical protein JW977_03100 [Candidatus Falkowbacteria bacterium]|nr:hypothetical protein [Candidatus Falkowbacteria bacterium]
MKIAENVETKRRNNSIFPSVVKLIFRQIGGLNRFIEILKTYLQLPFTREIRDKWERV